MSLLEIEERTAIAVLLERGHSQCAVARLMAVSEVTVRYHPKRIGGAVVDGRSKQAKKSKFICSIQIFDKVFCPRKRPNFNFGNTQKLPSNTI